MSNRIRVRNAIPYIDQNITKNFKRYNRRKCVLNRLEKIFPYNDVTFDYKMTEDI